MPRKARKFVRAPFFHIMCQGIKREKIFNTAKNMQKYLFLMIKYKEEFFVEIISYCIMPNHVHILVHAPNIECLSKFMHKINSIYATHYNNSQKRVGYVFRDRFKLEEITDIKYLFNCILYIHNNPIKANICKLPAQYKYSSYNEFVSEPKIINLDLIHNVLGKNINKEIIEKIPTDNILFLDVDEAPEDKANQIIANLEKTKQKKISEILANYKDRKELLIELHIKNKISYRCIERMLKIDRKKIKNYLFPSKNN